MGGWYELAITWLVHRPREVAADRGQSQVIGAILIFGFVIAGLGLYQVTVVPQQTSEVELQHSSTVKDDFADVHGSIVEAGSANDVRTASVKLGTRYPPRALTLNPAPVQGRLATESLGGSLGLSGTGVPTASEVCDSPAPPKTLTYEANYNRFNDAGHHGYETSVTYHAVNGNIVDSSQALVQGTTIRLLPLTDGSVSTTSIESQTLEFEGGTTGGGETPSGTPLTLTLPTNLSPGQWKTILSDADKVKTGSITKTGDIVTIPLEPGEYTIRCTPIGEGETPNNSPDEKPGSGSSGTSPSPGSGGVGINPNGEGEVVLTSASSVGGGGSNPVSVDLEYKPDSSTGSGTAELVGARANYLYVGGTGYSASGSETVTITDNSATLDFGGEYVDFTKSTTSGTVSIDSSSNGGTTLEFSFDDDINAQHYYVVTFTYKYPNGGTESSSYFISHPK
jgi:hypothetical protein